MRGSLNEMSDATQYGSYQMFNLQYGDVEIALTVGTTDYTSVRSDCGNALELGIFSRVRSFESKGIPVQGHRKVMPYNWSEGCRE